MDVRRLLLMAGVAASCAGCVTETKTVHVSAETAAKMQNMKEIDLPAHDAKPQTWIAVGEVHEYKAQNLQAAPGLQSAGRDEARKAYLKALELDPKCVSAHIHLANLYLQQQDPDRAIGVYDKALQLIPKSAALWHEAALVYLGRQDLNAALPCLAKAHELQPDDRNCATVFGHCLARAGRPGDAAIVLARVMNKADANYNVARMMAHVNQPEASRQYLRLALTDRPTHQGAPTLLAQLDGPAAPGVHQASFGPAR